MAPKKIAMKAPSNAKLAKAPKAKSKGKAKAAPKASPQIKAEPVSPTKNDEAQDQVSEVDVSQRDQQNFKTFLQRSSDPQAKSLKELYEGMARNDPKKKELIVFVLACAP